MRWLGNMRLQIVMRLGLTRNDFPKTLTTSIEVYGEAIS